MTTREEPQTFGSKVDNGAGLALAIVLGIPIGIALFIVTGNPGMLGVGAGCGVSIGVAISEARKRNRSLVGRATDDDNRDTALDT